MAFDNVVFPQIACRGVTKSEGIPMEAIGNGTFQSRNTPVRWGQFSYSISSVGMSNETKQLVKSFIRRRHYGLNSFKFADPDHPELVDEPMGHHSGNQWKLYLAELDETGSLVAGVHPVFHPGTLEIKVDGVVTPHTFSVIGGEPILTVVGTSGFETVTVSGEYHIAVILSSTLGWTISALAESGPAAVRSADFVLQEVFEY